MKFLNTFLLFTAIACNMTSGVAQTWIKTSAPNRAWSWVASSADGSKLVAVATANGMFGSGIYISTNFGSTWTSVLAVSASCVAASADGSYLVALSDVSPSQKVYTSTNYGSSWQQASPVHVSGNWVSIASSGDGKNLIGLNDASSGATYISQDAGISWVPTGAALGGFCVASSADGIKLAAALSDNHIYTSTNSGTTWKNSIFLSGSWMSVASSSDGTTLIASTFGGKVYTSRNNGATWKTNTVPVASWNCVTTSADGTRLVAAIQGGQIYSSTNSGTTWKTNNAPSNGWTSLASSADGSLVVAADFFGNGIWISRTMPNPYLNLVSTTTNVTLTWLIPSTNFLLQQSSNLASWISYTNLPVLNPANFQNELIFAPSNFADFFRLKSP